MIVINISLSGCRKAILLSTLLISGLLTAGCSSEITADPQGLLLAPEDFSGAEVNVVSTSEEQSLDGPSALVQLEGPDFRVLQTLVLFEAREDALAALDAIRADLANRARTEPGEREASGVFDDKLGNEEAAGLFFIERNGLVRLVVSGPGREDRLSDLAELARDKLADG